MVGYGAKFVIGLLSGANKSMYYEFHYNSTAAIMGIANLLKLTNSILTHSTHQQVKYILPKIYLDCSIKSVAKELELFSCTHYCKWSETAHLTDRSRV